MIFVRKEVICACMCVSYDVHNIYNMCVSVFFTLRIKARYFLYEIYIYLYTTYIFF